MIHERKVDRDFFISIVQGKKTFEVRKNDRDFQLGDLLALNETYDGKYTGDAVLAVVKYILDTPESCKDGFVIMGIKPCGVQFASEYGLRILLTREEARE
mgnify:CR=1 FL=1